MSETIKRIDSISSMGVFHEFEWEKSPVSEGPQAVTFKTINILYGRNYSGKTTLSRIFRAMETGKLSDKFESASFSVALADGEKVTQDSPTQHGKNIRVFNEDFIRDNLRFITNPDEGIEPFAILGDDNNKIEREIEQLQKELGSNDEGNETGLYADLLRAADSYSKAEKDHRSAREKLDKQLRAKATDRDIGIKYKPQRFGDQNYNFPKLESDIGRVLSANHQPLAAEEYEQSEKLILQEKLPPVPAFLAPVLEGPNLIAKARALVTKKINESDKIEDLIRDATLNRWASEGRALHKNKRDNCGFCGSPITDHRWTMLEKHFDREAEELESSIRSLIGEVGREKESVTSALKVDKTSFYAILHESIGQLQGTLKNAISRYTDSLASLVSQLEARRNRIFDALSFQNPHDATRALEAEWSAYEDIRKQSNDFSDSLSEAQRKAKEDLRLNEVLDYLKSIRYPEQITNIRELKCNRDAAEKENRRIGAAIKLKTDMVASKKRELNDEEKGAKKVNEYMNNFFGHHFLSLEAREQEALGEDSKRIRFEVIRDGRKAYHLSEGERSLLAFCYFLAKLQDVDTKDSKPIIWIDDPVSSLDANHIFFVFSLIDAEITSAANFEQLFVSTHNLNFLKYLKKLGGRYLAALGRREDYPRAYFQLLRHSETSTIAKMPRYLREYVTEYNYLFHQIHKCAEIEVIDDSNYTTYYHFANDARKFLEIYLYYKYPDKGMTPETLGLFFGKENIPAILTDRINNEYSHLSGVFERGSTPIEEPEMQTAAKQIIQRLKEEKDQYSALLNSVGLDEESS